MNIFVIEEFVVEDQNSCNFYTVRFDDALNSETVKFYDIYDRCGHVYDEDFRYIQALLELIVENGSRLVRRARNEARALALPPEQMIREYAMEIAGNKLRLYYVELTSNIWVLLGGGVAHNEPHGKPPIQFQEAQVFAKKIIEAMNSEYKIQNGKMIPLNGTEIIIH